MALHSRTSLSIVLLLLASIVAIGQPSTVHAAPPTITMVSPSSGLTLGGTQFTLTGTDFPPGVTVFVGGAAATGVTVVSPTQIVATTPRGLPGSANILVINPDGSAVTLNSGFFYTNPADVLAISTVVPASGPTLGGTTLTITGTGFTGGVVVLLGGVPSPAVTYLGPSMLTVRTPPGLPGVVPLVLRLPDGGVETRPNAFTYEPGGLEVSSISPGGGRAVGGTTVRIAGNAFAYGASVMFGSVPAANAMVVNSTLIVATTPASAAGTVPIRVTNPGGGSASFASGFVFNSDPSVGAGVISGITPATGSSLGGLQVTITGNGFSGGATVFFGGVPATDVLASGQSTVTARTPQNVAGPVTLTIVNSDGTTALLPNAFTYTGSSGFVVSGVSPASGPASGGTVVLISGNGFVTGASVLFGTVPARTATVVGVEQIYATTPPNAAGPVAITVTNPGVLSAMLPNGFTYLADSGAPASPPAAAPPAAAPPAASSGPGTFAAPPTFSTAGLASVVFNGGTVDQLEAAALSQRATGVWVQDSTGVYQLLVVGGPSFLKDAVKAKFPAGFSGVAAVTLTR